MRHTLFIDSLNIYRILRTREPITFVDEAETVTLRLLDGETVCKHGLKLKPTEDRRFRVFDMGADELHITQDSK